MRCGKCGNENAEGNRFCGMCGTPLVANPWPTASAQPRTAAPQSSTQGSRPALEEQRPIPRRDDRPTITGPSILGLNQPASGSHYGANDPHGSPGNVSYLLEDDEEEPKRGWWKIILVVLALALAGDFGYLRWKQGGFDWVTGGEKKPAQDMASSGAENTNSQTNPPATNVVSPQTGSSGTSNTSSSGSSAGNPPAGNDSQISPSTTSDASAPQTSPAQPTTPAPQTAPARQSAPPKGAARQREPGEASDRAESASQDEDENSDEEAPAKAPAVAKPETRRAASSKPSAAKPAAPKAAAGISGTLVAEAERLIYGRGASQDCDTGLRLLKRAAEQSDPKAMISMGALYSTGTCTPRDLPTAYRWFALALHKDPDNQTLQNDLQHLWSQMTQPERQLAIKLSQ